MDLTCTVIKLQKNEEIFSKSFQRKFLRSLNGAMDINEAKDNLRMVESFLYKRCISARVVQ